MDLYNGQLPDMLHRCGEDELSSSTPDRVMFIFIGDEDFLDLLQEMKESYIGDNMLIGYENFKILKELKLVVAKLSDIVSSGESNLIAFLEKYLHFLALKRLYIVQPFNYFILMIPKFLSFLL